MQDRRVERHSTLALDETAGSLLATIGCFLTVAQFIEEHEPEHAALLRAVSRNLIAKIPGDTLENIVGFAAEVVGDVHKRLCATARVH